jgi:hypothetical protein
MKGGSGKLTACILLFAALAISILSASRTRAFLPSHHGYLTSMGLAMGKNLDREHHFLLFTRKWVNAEGESGVDPHNRFPILSYALISRAESGCGNDPACEMWRGRILMLLFCWGALALSTLLLLELSANPADPLVAVSAALLAFSSYFLQYYNDMVFNDVPAVFGFILVLLGIARFEMRDSTFLLTVGALLGIALGWQCYAPLVTWWILQALRSLKTAGLVGGVREVLRSQATKTMVLAVAWGCLILGFNVLNEKSALKLPLGELPSVRSIQFRLGMKGGSEEFPEYQELKWGNFLNKQARRVMKATIPTRPLHAAVNRWSETENSGLRLLLGVTGLALLAGVLFCLGKLYFGMKRQRLAFLVVLFSGLLWCLSMRQFTAFHDFQAMFYVGFAMVLFWAILSRLPQKAMGWVAVGSLAVFAFSAVDLNGVKTEEGRNFESRTADFAAIRKVVGENRRIQVGLNDAEFEAEFIPFRFYMAGNFYSDPGHAEFVITRDRSFASSTLTPDNHEYFLFRTSSSSSP